MRIELPLDPKLPRLEECLDVSTVAQDFAALWRSAESCELRSCRRANTRYEPGASLVAVYELEGRGPGSDEKRTLGAVTIDRFERRVLLFHQDPLLPQLAELSRTSDMARRLGTLPHSVTGGRSSGDHVVVPLRYKPGVGCVVRLDPRARPERRLFCKVLKGGGRDLAATLALLHEAAAIDRGLPRLPPVGLWEDLDAVVQPEVNGGVELGMRLFDRRFALEARIESAREAGAALGALHDSSLPAPVRSLEDDLAELGSYRGVVSQLAPELLWSMERGMERLSGSAGDHGGVVPSHGALRSDQVLVSQDGIAFVDLDSFCLAPAGRDLGNLVAYLDWKAVRGAADPQLVAAVQSAFLAGYESRRKLPPSNSIARYRALTMLKIAGRRYSNLSVGEWVHVPRLMVAANEWVAA